MREAGGPERVRGGYPAGGSSRSRRGAQRSPKAAILITAAVCFASWASAQTVEVYPSALKQVPVAGLGPGTYWQQVRIVLEQADAASDAAISIDLPPGVVIHDRDSDGAVYDEVRVVYQARAAEAPRFSASTATTPSRITLKSSDSAAAGGRLYVQFPIGITARPSSTTMRYRAVWFDDPREQDLLSEEQLPALSLVNADEFAIVGSLDLLVLAPSLAPGPDTTTSAVGTVYPDEARVLIQSLPDLVFDGGEGRPNRQVGWGDGDDSNDTAYRFFFSTNPSLVAVDSAAVPACRADGTLYVEREGVGEPVQLLTSQLPTGTYYLYATSAVTGDIALARSRAIEVHHDPAILSFGQLGQPITIDSGGLYDLDGDANGQGPRRLILFLEVVDHDDPAAVHLFYSANPNLGRSDVAVPQGLASELDVSLRNGIAITPPEGLAEEVRTYEWRIAAQPVVPPGEYYVYAAAVAEEGVDLARTDYAITVQHAPFLRLDAVDDSVVGAAEPATVSTGGERPQRYLTITWSRRGPGGDADADDNALISLYFSDVDTFRVPGGGEELEEAAADPAGHTRAIVTDLREDPDERADNQYVWDLWAAAESGSALPRADRTYYVYGIIADSSDSRVVQMNGGRLSDAGSRLRFRHPPTVRPIQPLVDVTVEAGLSGRVSWEDMDLDDDARIRVILSAEDHGEMATYDEVTSGTDFVVNSADGRAQPEVDSRHDLSENSSVDYIDVRPEHLMRSINGESRPQAGDYYVYIAVEDGPTFGAGTLAWRTRGRMRLSSPASAAASPSFALAPQVFTLGTGLGRQYLDVLVNDGGEAADLVQATLSVDGNRFAVADQDTAQAGLQPFRVGQAFSPAKLVTNRVETAEDGTLFLSFAYFDPTGPAIDGLDGRLPVVNFELVALDLEGSSTVLLVGDAEAGRISQLERNGLTVVSGQPGVLATGNLLPGRARLSGKLALEGRFDRGATVDVDLRPWGDYRPLADPVFAAANDADPERLGVQVQLDGEGSFELTQVPTGRLDLYAHLDGYLDAWHAGLDLYSNQTVSGLRPTSTGLVGDSLMLGGDVAGYTGPDGVSQPDNEVTLADWDFVASLFGRALTAEDDSARADITGDGTVNIRDLALVGANYLVRGPRPVFRPASPGDGAPDHAGSLRLRGALRRSSAEVLAGQKVEYAALVEGPGIVRSYQVDLVCDPSHWQVPAVPGLPAGEGVLATHRDYSWGQRCAATSVGRLATLYASAEAGEPQELVVWELTALVDAPEPPALASALLLDRWDRAVTLAAAGDAPTAVGEVAALPSAPHLAQNYPNPFNPETAIGFELPAEPAGDSGLQRVRLEVYNTLGQLVTVLVDDWRAPGQYLVTWDGRDGRGLPVASGLYFYRLATGARSASTRQTQRMILLR